VKNKNIFFVLMFATLFQIGCSHSSGDGSNFLASPALVNPQGGQAPSAGSISVDSTTLALPNDLKCKLTDGTFMNVTNGQVQLSSHFQSPSSVNIIVSVSTDNGVTWSKFCQNSAEDTNIMTQAPLRAVALMKCSNGMSFWYKLSLDSTTQVMTGNKDGSSFHESYNCEQPATTPSEPSTVGDGSVDLNP
jgi:hypothetical protein